MSDRPAGSSTGRSIVMAGLFTFALLTAINFGRAAVSPQAGSPPAPPPPAPAPAPPPSHVAGGGFTLTSVSVTFPDQAQYPAGPGADVMNSNCTACHSPSMVLNQPRLSSDQWKATVEKMRETYKAPVAEKDVPAIVNFLNAMSAQVGSG
jgi:cytochrome c5